MVAAAEPYVRIKIRVPEAYLLLFDFDATRPGLLVLDADGRRVNCIALPGAGAAKIDAPMIAELLDDARTGDAVEEFVLTVTGDTAAFRDAVEEWEEVEDTAVRGNQLRVAISQGEAKLAKFQALAQKRQVKLDWVNPVAVASPAAGAPGVWYEGRAVAVLLDPKALPQDLEARTYRLPGVSQGAGGAGVARAPLVVPGVVAVFPDIFGGKQTVVARKGGVAWKQVEKAFRNAGVAATQVR